VTAITTPQIATMKSLARDSTGTHAKRFKCLAKRNSAVEATPQMMRISSGSRFQATAINAVLIRVLSFVDKSA